MFVGVDAHIDPHGARPIFANPNSKPVIAPRADRVVRPYRTSCEVADGVCNFAIVHRRGERGIDPYGFLLYSLLLLTSFCPAPTLRRNAHFSAKNFGGGGNMLSRLI